MGKRVDLFGHDWNEDKGLGDTVSRVIKKLQKVKLRSVEDARREEIY